MRIVKRDVYLSEFAEMDYTKRLAYVWLNLFLGEIEMESPLNPLDWTLRSIAIDLWSCVLIWPFVLCVLIPASFFEAAGLRTRYKDDDVSWYNRDEYVLE